MTSTILGDLVSLLRGIDDIDVLSPLLACDVAALLQDADRVADTRDKRPIRCVEVINVAEPTRYVPDPAQPDDPLRWMDDDEAEQQDRIDAGLAALLERKAAIDRLRRADRA